MSKIELEKNQVDHPKKPNRLGFMADAETALKDLLATGQGYDAEDVHSYIRNKIEGKNPAKPKSKYIL
ncbi:hypothetical protein [Sulfurirhabdus autotrophica]|uniref:Uncharacterized protein n=1 Tax=Sulfurirhabdus autotrophica TaxID=1706046 RepID=A0A4R3XQL9_9PROT|nr:hypothetical protein [Sulfurirhabdus autotrophica]TCV81081.1 hypothetical protein EDC63_12739 [Sulfurirhabdus autotrophica]